VADDQDVPGTRAKAAAGALFFDDQDRVMLVRPTYKEYLDIPGGYVEPGETPYEACVREVKEELGIEPPIGRLLVADWAPHPTEGDKILFIFDGGQLSAEHLVNVRLDPGELAEKSFHAADELPTLLIDRLRHRILSALEARQQGMTIYLERGRTLRCQ
jgi:8-oxo-dGTP diphosphatase